MEETAASDIERLPEDLLAAVISLTSPPDACRAAAVSRTFRAAANSDAVWSHFLPCDLPEIDQGELAFTAASKKALFKCLRAKPVLLSCRGLCMKLDRVTGDMYYHHRSKLVLEEEEDIGLDEDDETPEQCEWISLGCRDTERNKTFESFQSAFWTS